MDNSARVTTDSSPGLEPGGSTIGVASPSSWTDAMVAAGRLPVVPDASDGPDAAGDDADGSWAAGPGHPAGACAIPAADLAEAAGLVVGATDPATGQADTAVLGRQIAEAAAQDPAKAGAAYHAVHEQLQQRDPRQAQQLDADVARAVGDLAKGAASGLGKAGAQVLASNPILSKQWISTESAWTGESGFTKGLYDLLDSNGIAFDLGARSAPAGSLGPSSGVPSAVANNRNGLLAENQIADSYRKRGFEVAQQQPVQGGSRVVDVRVTQPAVDPRFSRTLDIESKVGRTGLDSHVRAQVAKDAQALAENGSARAVGGALETTGKVLRPVAVVADAVQLGQAFHQDGDKVGVNTGRAASGIAGGWGGAVAGAEGGAAVGALVGSAVPVVGTAVGGAVGAVAGGIGGGIGGDWARRRLFDTVKSRF